MEKDKIDFKREDFSEKFISKFKDNEFDILLDFCESYNKRFGKYTSILDIADKVKYIDISSKK